MSMTLSLPKPSKLPKMKNLLHNHYFGVSDIHQNFLFWKVDPLIKI